jgi:hypothetical protein
VLDHSTPLYSDLLYIDRKFLAIINCRFKSLCLRFSNRRSGAALGGHEQRFNLVTGGFLDESAADNLASFAGHILPPLKT